MMANSIGRLFERVGRRLRRYGQPRLIWLDVGAHLGENTFQRAAENPNLLVYAFEPNLKLAARCTGILPNFVVLPFAISETDGADEFHLNCYSQASSLLPFNSVGLSGWRGGEVLRTERTILVPTLRLDTFMNQAEISKVDFLKVDAQGTDLAVLKSAGDRLRDIREIDMEVSITPIPLYDGSCSREECLRFMANAGFSLVNERLQSHDQEANLTFVLTSDAIPKAPQEVAAARSPQGSVDD